MPQKSLLRNRRRSLLEPWHQVDWLLMGVYVAMTIFGAVMIHSVNLKEDLPYSWQHLVTGILGFVIALAIARCNYEILVRWKWIIYGFTNFSLIAVQIVGTTALGAQRWINIGGFHVQPSEFAKVGLILTLAAFLESKVSIGILDLAKALAIAGIPWVLVFFEPNLGTSLILGSITVGILYWANVNPGWLVLLISPLVSAIVYNVYVPVWVLCISALAWIAWRSLPWPWLTAPIAVGINIAAGNLGQVLWRLLKDYQKDRLTGFLNPEKDPLGTGYHLIQSRIAIGSGQLHGRGLFEGTQTQLSFIPEQHTDFIFSAIGEELGFIGCLCVLACFWFICFRLVIIAQTAKDNFGSLLTIGVVSMLIFQMFINIGMNIGLAPVTGIPLPLLSYGRSALLSNFIALGLVQAVANRRPKQTY